MTTRKRDMRPEEAGATAAPAPRVDPELEQDLGPQLTDERTGGDELAEAREEAARNLAAAQHWQAEFENYRRRQERSLADLRARAGERVITELLPIVDDLDRAIDHTMAGASVGPEFEQLLKGVEMVRSRLVGVLENEGVEIIDPFGQPFDPELHQGVGQREDIELPEHTVVEVYQKGYRLAGRTLRPAMVVVSTGGPA